MPTDWLDPEAPAFDDESPDDYHSECGYLWTEHHEQHLERPEGGRLIDLLCPSEQEQRERFGK